MQYFFLEVIYGIAFCLSVIFVKTYFNCDFIRMSKISKTLFFANLFLFVIIHQKVNKIGLRLVGKKNY
jgi:hypothetical protein